jgi:hypothetical protein
MGSDEAALLWLWQEKRGEVEFTTSQATRLSRTMRRPSSALSKDRDTLLALRHPG